MKSSRSGLLSFARLVSVVSLVSVVACSSEDDDSASSAIVGVNDVAKACGIRVQWAQQTAAICNTCQAYARSPKCECGNYDFSGKCSEQEKAVTSDASCEQVDVCVRDCNTDCGCVERCYDGRACKAAAAARDGCVAEVCAPHCR